MSGLTRGHPGRWFPFLSRAGPALVQEVAAAENVRSMPTFVVYRYGAKAEAFSGADPGKLRTTVEKYLPTVA